MFRGSVSVLHLKLRRIISYLARACRAADTSYIGVTDDSWYQQARGPWLFCSTKHGGANVCQRAASTLLHVFQRRCERVRRRRRQAMKEHWKASWTHIRRCHGRWQLQQCGLASSVATQSDGPLGLGWGMRRKEGEGCSSLYSIKDARSRDQ